jgi:histidyl-tRNA synthetase
VIKVNNRKVLDGVMEAIGLAGDENAARRLIVLRAIDKLDRLGPEGVAALLGAGRKDESGDFTKGAGLEAKAIETILAFTSAKAESAAETMANLAVVVSGSAIGAEGVSELAEIASLVTAGGYEDGRVVIDPSVVRGLEYYTGPVFEAELTFEVKGDDGKPVRFGSVAGGGRYDGLVARFRGEPVPATGFSVGVSRLLSALSILGKLGGQAEAKGPVVVLVMDKDQIAHYQRLVSTLRQAGIKAELYLGGSGMKAQMKYADKRGSVCVVIQGSDEREKGEVLIKDLVLGATLSSAPDRDAYLKQQAEAQFAVSEGDMIAAVGKVLARHR